MKKPTDLERAITHTLHQIQSITIHDWTISRIVRKFHPNYEQGVYYAEEILDPVYLLFTGKTEAYYKQMFPRHDPAARYGYSPHEIKPRVKYFSGAYPVLGYIPDLIEKNVLGDTEKKKNLKSQKQLYGILSEMFEDLKKAETARLTKETVRSSARP